MKNFFIKFNFPLLGALVISLYFVYKLILGGNDIVLIEVMLFPVAILLFPLQMLAVFPVGTIYAQVAVVVGIPIIGFILFWVYRFIYFQVRVARNLSTKVRVVVGFILISWFLWSLPNLIATTHDFKGAMNIFTGDCETFGGRIPLGYISDPSCHTIEMIPEVNILKI